MPDREADFVTILSSDMIAQIVEEYFNKKVYKQQVEVVDTKPTEAGYMFSLAFVHKVEQVSIQSKSNEASEKYRELGHNGYRTSLLDKHAKRNNKGQFVKDSM